MFSVSFLICFAQNEQTISSIELVHALEKLASSEDYVLCYAGSAKKNFSVRSLMTSLSLFAASPKALNKSELGFVFRL